MLHELLQGADAGWLLLIQDSCSCSGRPLLWSFIKSASIRKEVVHVLSFEVSEDEMEKRLKGSPTERLHFHDAYSDPLGWTDGGGAAFTVDRFCSEEVTRCVKRSSQLRPAILVIDSLSWILRHHSTPAVCQTLQQLKKGGVIRNIIALLHSDMHQLGTPASLCHLATSLVTVAAGLNGNEAKITKRLKSGKVLQDEETFTIMEDLTVIGQSKPSNAMQLQEQETDPAANLTFNLRLSDAERDTKEKLALPFVFSKEKKAALLNPGAGMGRIMYEPDANDDYDQEDPDDDLDV
ncbi:elongator complex protein 5 isoform X2 [Dunckerocampus dactyliophorus]|uniref:elongator complex protein 5 isoform X2 n=1 Tax=Dunckerocampus dactyliophorus TaxID=161453 RepID=UPI0024071B16|nr:elongator complex protein 5 isoform X2 [Dunckerocampus dactyliophorus]